ncbi:MAG TPA: YceI family protein [Acidimicrobiales bacterium]|jgi:polyisoprenoid-binding protein YceI|nr:YceI family protein [Acidimicrobiales bacterium]
MKRWLKWLIGGLVLLAVLLVGGPFVYIHFIEGPAPKPLTLPSSHHAPDTPASFPTGSWKATSASVVGYRVNEVLFGQNNVAVGRTHSVTGAIALKGANVSTAAFTVQMATVHSDQSQRDNQFDGRIMDVSRYPTATFRLTSPITLGFGTKAGITVQATATGDLTMHGQTHAVTFPVSARYTASAIDITGSIPITFATWGISNPGFGGQITVDDHGLLEFLLVLHAS